MNDKGEKLKIGISACLVGDNVRHNGGNKKFRLLDTMKDSFEFIKICPEVAVGMGVPRPAVRLLKKENKIHLVQSKDITVDFTDKMSNFASEFCNNLPDDLCGFIVKKGSPTCAKYDSKIYSEKGIPSDKSPGMFTKKLLLTKPLLPVEDEGRLNDHGLRDLFLKKIYARHRWLVICKDGYKPEKIINFHRDYKYIITAHSPSSVHVLGGLLSNLKGYNIKDVFKEYITIFLECLSFAAKRKHTTVALQHISGYFKEHLTSDEINELYNSIMSYSKGSESLISSITLMKHYIRKYNIKYLETQYFFHPYPPELMHDFI